MKFTLLLLLSIFASSLLTAQPIFQKSLKVADASGILYRCIPMGDGSYTAAGVITDNLEFNDNFLIAKINSLGDREWIKSINSDYSDEFSDLAQTPEGEIIAVGSSLNFDNFLSNGVVMKFDENGTRVWSKSLFLTGSSCNARKVQIDFSGNIYVLGTYDVGGSSTDYFIMKMDPSGNIIEQTNIGTSNSDYVLSFLRKANGELFIGGWGNTGSGESIHLIKLDETLAVVWNSLISGVDKFFAYELKEKSNGNLVMAGRYDDTVNPYDIMLLEVNNTNGSVVWCKSYHLTDNKACYAYGLTVNTNDRLAVTGLIEDFNSETVVMETNSTGTINWAKKVNSVGELSGYGYGICRTADLGYLVCGTRMGIDSSIAQMVKINTGGGFSCISTNLNFSSSDQTPVAESIAVTTGISSIDAADLILTETELSNLADACQPLSVQEPISASGYSVFPNPCDGDLSVVFREIDLNTLIRVTDLTGKTVYENQEVKELTNAIHLDLEAGMYILQVTRNGKMQSTKLVIR
ncbi:MAG: T9SS type A sorting domain-containing protein [Bacteroidales bacterium]|nr:T9SS type A sorting domain-containing protein [Bacteroidales bacterium]